MYKINILTSISYPLFSQEFDKERYGNLFEVYENSHDNVVWDAVIVYENISVPQHIKFKEGGLIFISGEPPLSRVYPQEFVNQFDVFLTTHPHIKHPRVIHSQLAINWHFGLSFKTKEQRYSFEDLKNLEYPKKDKLFSIITSSKTMMPGHNYRQIIIDNLKRDFSNYIDFYGKGSNFVDCKCDALLPYRFHICMENSIVSHYWSEKFADPLLGYSVPIYSGCPNIDDYFNPDGYMIFNMKKYETIKGIVEQIISEPEQLYNKYFEALVENRNRLISHYTIFNLIEYLMDHEIVFKDDICDSVIIPYEMCHHYKRGLYSLALKRKIYKTLINLGLK